MRIVIVGLGSMGKRRLRLLRHFFPNATIAGIDAKESRRSNVSEFNIEVFSDLPDAISKFRPDVAFICTSPLAHDNLTETCLSHGIHVFSEINLVKNGYLKNLMLAREKKLILFISSTFLYRKEIDYLRSKVCFSDICLYTYHVGQYLPDWHPWESHKDFFLSDKRTNGIREILAINLPWLFETFGPIQEVFSFGNKITELDIDYLDCRVIAIRHQNGTIGTFTADLVSREPICSLRIENENFLIKWDGKPDSLYEYSISDKNWAQIKLYNSIDKLTKYSENIIEDAYRAEIEDFLDAIQYDTETKWSFEKDINVINLINKIEK